MKTLLINPPRQVPQPSDLPPLGLAYLAGAIHANGQNVKILEASSYSWSKVRQQLESLNPDVVGVTCWSIAVWFERPLLGKADVPLFCFVAASQIGVATVLTRSLLQSPPFLAAFCAHSHSSRM